MKRTTLIKKGESVSSATLPGASPSRVLVTGGAGFIGRWIVHRLLAQGHDVWVLDNLANGSEENLREFAGHKRFHGLQKGDVANPEDVTKAFATAPQVVIHAAAEIEVQKSLDRPASHFAANVVGTYNVLEEARRVGARLAILGTCMVYDTAGNEAISETHATKPASPYAGSKLAAEDLAYSYFRGYGLPVTILRPFNTYGPFQKSNMEGGVVSIFVRKVLDGKDLSVFGDGTQTRDLLYVEDCAEFITTAAFHPKALGEVINAGLGRDIAIKDLALLIAKDPKKVKFVPHHHPQSEVMKLLCDRRKAKALLGWEPKVTLEEGIRRLTEWTKAQGAVAR